MAKMNDTLEIELKRLYIKPDHIIGQLSQDGEFFCDTLERPWLNNQENVSCIPAGRYQVSMLMSAHFNRVLPHILCVPNRTEVMIHPGNTVADTEGCVLVGRNTAPATLTDSRATSDRLNLILMAETKPVWITVIDV